MCCFRRSGWCWPGTHGRFPGPVRLGVRAEVRRAAGGDLAARFPEIAAAARSLGDVFVDGELVALPKGDWTSSHWP